MTYNVFALGDSAITIDLGNKIDVEFNNRIIALFNYFTNNPVLGMIEAIPAYSSLTIVYDVEKVKQAHKNIPAYVVIKNEIEKELKKNGKSVTSEQRKIEIPVCYDAEFAPDLSVIAGEKNLSPEDIIRIHTAVTYRVYMLGFLPGFAYMGEVSDEIATPRKSEPRRKVEAGSVGIAGKQTGIYPVESPGGWQIIGRTPYRLFDAQRATPALLLPGDDISFYSISKEAFLNWKHEPADH